MTTILQISNTCTQSQESLGKTYPDKLLVSVTVANWSFLTNHGRALLCIGRDPTVRLRDIAANLDITERRAHEIVTDLVGAGYILKSKDGRRNRYEVQAHMPLPEPASRDRAVGDMLKLLGNSRRRSSVRRSPSAERRRSQI